MEYFAPYWVITCSGAPALRRSGAGIIFSSNRKNDEGSPA